MRAGSPGGVWVLLALACAVTAAHARNVDLSTVPQRETVQLTIYNSEDLTLVRETRVASFKPGVNPLQFSWANTLIDPTSVELRFRSHAEQLSVLDTTFPHDKPQLLYWNVESEEEVAAEVEITYFTSGIAWSADYIAIADPREENLALTGFVRVHNRSGEEYENAQVRLVVGTINLVEKIAELARVPVGRVRELEQGELADLRRRAAKDLMMRQEAVAGAVAPVPAEAPTRPKEVYKEGLSEYFIYTIAGTETVPDGWAKRLRSFQADHVPIKVEYRYRPREYGDRLVRLYLLANDHASGLGSTPLPDGTVRVFRDNGQGGLSYLASQSIEYVPIGDKIELNLEADREVVFAEVKRAVFRDNIWMRYTQGNLYRRLGEESVRLELDSTVAGWDEHQVFGQRIRNYTGRPIDVEVRRQYSGDVTFRSRLDPTLHDYQTVQLRATVAPGEKAELLYEVIRREGYNAKQDRVKLETGAVRTAAPRPPARADR
jgi:hypothetical protein